MVANENGGEQKSKRVKVRERERGGSFFPRSPAARGTDPLTEGLEQAILKLEKCKATLSVVALPSRNILFACDEAFQQKSHEARLFSSFTWKIVLYLV